MDVFGALTWLDQPRGSTFPLRRDSLSTNPIQQPTISALVLWRVNPVIFRARNRFQPGPERWDRILLALMLPAMVTEIPVATLDAGRVFWSSVPFPIIVFGYALLAVGIAIGAWAQAVNRFFEPGVRLQRERGQHVITSGPYNFVRDPGYVLPVRRYRWRRGGR